jgi:phosphate transport system protein
MGEQHIVQAFDQELRDITGRVVESAALAGDLLARAVAALAKMDAAVARAVIADDRRIDQMQREVEERAILMIARRQPMARDLREIVAAFRIANDVERIGDLAKNIAKRVVALQGQPQPAELIDGLQRMAELGLDQLSKVMAAYSSRDLSLALEVWTQDEWIDARYTSMFQEILDHMIAEPRNVALATHLLFSAKNLERIGDHTTNIAETVHYLITGTPLTDERPKQDGTVMPVPTVG